MSDEYKVYPGRDIFPIHTETACMLKWSWSTVNMTTAKSASCHRTEFANLDPDNFASFHNLPEKIAARKLMLEGQWPGHGCEYCRNVEQRGGTSDRLMTLNRQHGLDKIPPELLVNPQATEVTPTILEVYFNNTCNLSCIYCQPAQSSKWEEEIRKYGTFTTPGKTQMLAQNTQPGYEQRVQALWQYLTDNNRYQTIRHFHLLGGESLLQRELDMCMDFFEQHPNPSLTFNIVTNLMLPSTQFQAKIDRFKQLVDKEAIFQLEITGSLDCWGPEQEYVRHGLDLSTWQSNFEYLLDKPWINVAIHSCINALSIKTMPELINKINQWNQLRPADRQIDHSFDLVLGQGNSVVGLNPTAFGPDFFTKDFELIFNLMPDSTDGQRTAKTQMSGLARVINNSTKDLDKISNLIEYLTELDQRRNTNWHGVFPWLAQFEQPSII